MVPSTKYWCVHPLCLTIFSDDVFGLTIVVAWGKNLLRSRQKIMAHSLVLMVSRISTKKWNQNHDLFKQFLDTKTGVILDLHNGSIA